MTVPSCPGCGNNRIRQGAKFCGKCGFPLGRRKLAELTFGRYGDRDIRLESKMVSRHHARAILVDDGSWYLQDEGSKNGTYVDEQKLTPGQWRQVQVGMTVRLADIRLRLLPEGWQRIDTGEWVWRQREVSCPHCETQLSKLLLLAFCPACGFPLRWLEVPTQQTFTVNVRYPSPLPLRLTVKGIGSEPLEIEIRSAHPERLQIEGNDGQATNEVKRRAKAGEEVLLMLLPNLPFNAEQPYDCTLRIRSLFFPMEPQNERPHWRPEELVEERSITIRLEPVFVRLEWQPSLLLFSKRRTEHELKLTNLSPIMVSGTIECPDELTVQPSKQWKLEPKESLILKVSARKSWQEGKELLLKAQPKDGDSVSCHAFWFGRETETTLMPHVVIGVDFGTAKSAIAFKRHGSNEIELLKVQGEETIPSILLFLPNNREPLIGHSARARLGDPTALPVQGIKLLLRRSQPIEWQGQTWTPQQLARYFLRFLKDQIDKNFGDDNVCKKRFELNLPVLENEQDYEEQKQMSLKAAQDSGMGWVRVWWEPICAAAWVLYRWKDYAPNLPLPKPKNLILVIDWGAGTLDTALLTYEQPRPPFFQLPPLWGIGLERGGDFLDWLLTCEFLERTGLKDLLEEAKKLGWKQFRWKGSLALRQLAEAIRQGKENVSQTPQSTQYTVSNARRWLTEPVFANLDANLPLVTTHSLDRIVKQILDELKEKLDIHLGDDGWSKIDYAFITGGSGQIKVVRSIVGEWIEKQDQIVQLRDRDAIFAVALGSVVLNEVQIDALPFGLSLQVNNEIYTLLREGESVDPNKCIFDGIFNVPVGGLCAYLQANIGSQNFAIATYRAEGISSQVQVKIKIDDGWLSWQWLDLGTDKVLWEQRILALP